MSKSITFYGVVNEVGASDFAARLIRGSKEYDAVIPMKNLENNEEVVPGLMFSLSFAKESGAVRLKFSNEKWTKSQILRAKMKAKKLLEFLH